MGMFTKNAKVEALKQVPLFEGLSKKELTEIANASEDIELEAGATLIKEGGLAREFFVILDGTIEITRGGRHVRTGSAPDFVGEIGLMAHTKRTATVTAKTPVRCFILNSRDFRRTLDDNPAIERKLSRALAERLVALGQDAV